MKDASRQFARITLDVYVHLETEAGINTPDAYEPGYEYFAVRDVAAISVQAAEGANLHAVTLIAQAGFDDQDPDDLIGAALTDALLGLMPEEADHG